MTYSHRYAHADTQPIFKVDSISGRQYIIEICYFIQSDKLNLATGLVTLFRVNVIIDMIGFKSTILVFSVYSTSSLFPFPSFSAYFCIEYFFMIPFYLNYCHYLDLFLRLFSSYPTFH